jgi:hypothetical protein
MMRFDGQEVAREFGSAFERDIKGLTVRQLWWLVKMIKHCRGRCRSNAALYAYLNRNFPGALFREVPRVDEKTQEEYEGLEITLKEPRPEKPMPASVKDEIDGDDVEAMAKASKRRKPPTAP